ncbi:S-layer homology domain-containing protein [Solibacillus daqui]|uniref:S-layer homology domain-containing protein n=1 Tax=Solibacillus daqui TaxID=2912187 RepID=UPI002366E99B|nr:S-layer homology domain-containing protein [Solibacillus daqui]
MESKKAQKLSKATVATVLAVSGVIVAIPQGASASNFSDVSQYSDYYEPIVDLVSRNIISGYPDGTFKPNKSITREEAAKMLARTIDVNITNPSNPGFKDVKTSDANYRYIAALAAEGIINGYPDGKFHPKEPITRAQMSKILSLGFKLGISTKLNHGFKDVASTNPNAYYIQTLYDLNITKGVSAIKFDPFNTVTRAQMATFIWRAEKADRGTPVYEVGDIIGDQIYINGVAHTIANHLRSILNASNKNILKGAYIEGDFTGNKINNITKLTINASGTSSRLLAMDGDYTSFAGELVVNGSYLRFKNINFTGRVELAEPPRRSLAGLSEVRVAGIPSVADFIDWKPPTNNNGDDSLNTDEDESLVDKPDPSNPQTKYKDRMPNLKKYVDFESSELRHVYVTANHAFLKSDDDIDRLYVQGDVSNFELYADANAMYIDTDFNVTIYGSHDIKYAYKNSLKNVYLRSDATYDYYYVTASNGYTNLGEFAYITNAIIPVNKTVNDVFDDFETDEPNIGHIEDENGKEVSRDPVGDNDVSDKTQPIITQLDVKAGGTVADVTLTANENGTYYYVVRPSSEKAPSINEIKTGGFKFNGSGPIVMDEQVKFQVTGLETKTEYTIYAIVIDDADNVSEKKSVDFTTIDNSPPRFTLQPGAKQPGGKRFEVKFTKISEPGTIYYYVREKGSSSVDPTIDDIIKKHTGTKLVTKPEDLTEMIREFGLDPNKGAIQPNTTYEVFAVMVDKTDNRSNLVEKIEVKTEAPDPDHPYVAKPDLVLDDRDKGYFYVDVNEALDKETAENPANYLLSGTGIVNITGHKEIQPVEVKLESGGKRVRVTIPAVTSLVQGDTIRLTILKGVQDLAENEFENADTIPVGQEPRNYAEYHHTDALSPVINIKNIITGPDKYEVEVNTNKAGTYYYMILPDNYDFTTEDITNRDFVDEFSTDPNVITGKFQTTTQAGTKDDYIASGQNPATLGTFKFDITKPGTPPRDPFLSYRLHIVLKDRSGKLSTIANKSLIDDAKPPLVTNYAIKNVSGNDKQIEFTANVDEKANFYVLPVKKYNKKVVDGVTTYELNTAYFDASGNLKDLTDALNTPVTSPDLFTTFKSVGAKVIGGSEGKGTVILKPQEKLLNLEAHEEYGFYIGAVDTIGNFTILQRSSAPETAEDEPKGPQMKTTLYMDGTKPYIKSPSANPYGAQTPYAIIHRTPDSKFEITFNETILRQNATNISEYNKSKIKLTNSLDLSSILKITNEAGTEVTEQYVFDGYTVGTETTSESTLVIKSNVPTDADKSITVELKDDIKNAYDYVNKNTFDISKFGRYIYPTNDVNIMSDAILGTPLADPNNSKEIIITPQLSASDVKEVYYIVVNDGSTYVPTQKDILNIVRYGTQPSGAQVNLYGKKLIEKPADTSAQMTLVANGTNNVFRRGQKVYMITLDRYGNINWVVNETNRNQKYSVVK